MLHLVKFSPLLKLIAERQQVENNLIEGSYSMIWNVHLINLTWCVWFLFCFVSVLFLSFWRILHNEGKGDDELEGDEEGGNSWNPISQLNLMCLMQVDHCVHAKQAHTLVLAMTANNLNKKSGFYAKKCIKSSFLIRFWCNLYQNVQNLEENTLGYMRR